jgi:pimeloyl-ACP methyl ester carboxylesterase
MSVVAGVALLAWPAFVGAAALALTDRATESTTVRVIPRPVVLVHGFLSDHSTWTAWTGPDGFLARHGLVGYAVGDGQVEGRLDTGDITRPTATTKTLAENAAALGRYIDGVRGATGAEMVDLVAHSMGGLISRYYISELMRDRDVGQLLMLGSPHGGSECSALPVALGLFGPAALELRPTFLRQIFNRTVTRRHGVPFHMLAGDPIVESFKAPCTGVPSDSVVGIQSVSAIPGTVERLPVLHTDMTGSPAVFETFVLPHLQRGIDSLGAVDDPLLVREVPEPTQFTKVITGRVEPGSRVDVVVDLDRVAIASFALFDTARRLQVTVRGASGQIVALNARDHGLIRVDDPSSLLTLGYGFRHPRPGPWRITLESPPAQPGSAPIASEFSLSARVVGGAMLRARARPLAPLRGRPVTLSAALEDPEAALTAVSMRAVIRRPDGKSESLDFAGRGIEQSASWRPHMTGIHGIDVVASAVAGGMRVERTTFLAVDVR